MTGAVAGHQVIVFLQENKTTDFYFPTLAAWGAAVANHGALLSTPPNFDQPHDRNAWVHYAMGDYPALNVQVDNDTVIPFYSWLAKQYTFCDHHFGLGSNSTSGHMLAIGGQTPTLKNPPFIGPAPTWDLPSIFSVAQAAGVSWAAFPDGSGYPTKLYTSLTVAPHRPARPPRHGCATGGHLPVPGGARGLVADPAPPPGARIDYRPAQGPAPHTQADTTGPVARAAEPADARPGHPRRQHPARTNRRTRSPQTPQAPEESVTAAGGETRRVQRSSRRTPRVCYGRFREFTRHPPSIRRL